MANREACELYIEQEIKEGDLPGRIRAAAREAFTGFAADLKEILGEDVSIEKAKAIACFCPPASRGVEEGYIYFVRASKMVKIGFTVNIDVRIKTLQSMSPTPLDVIAVVYGPPQIERDLHQQFSHLRRHGEWFDAAPDLMAFIKEIKETS